jgi:hypothetical protein
MPGSLPEPPKSAFADTQAEPPDIGGRGKAVPGSHRWLVAAVSLLSAVVTGSVVWWVAGPSPPQPGDGTETVAAAWNRTISALDIEPIFPPEEDVYVGDVFVVVTHGELAEIGRMVRVWHVDMSTDLDQAYSGMPFFEPAVNAQAAAPSGPPARGAPVQADTLFHSSVPPRDLSLVAFPGFTIRHARSAQSGLKGGGGLLGFFGLRRDNQETVEFQLTSSGTYGVPSIMATNRLAELCTDPFTKQICTPEVARRELSMVVGNRAEEKVGENRYALEVELILVSRVYLTRSIAQRRSSNSVVGMQAKMMVQLKALAQQSTLPETMRKQLSDMSDDLSEGLAEGSFKYTAVDGNTIQLEQTFNRPLVIGYRAVRTVLPYPESDK